MKRKSKSYLRLTVEEVEKLNLCCKSIIGNYSKHEVVSGLIDGGFATALESLYSEDLITDQEFNDGLDKLPDYLQEKVRAKLQG